MSVGRSSRGKIIWNSSRAWAADYDDPMRIKASMKESRPEPGAYYLRAYAIPKKSKQRFSPMANTAQAPHGIQASSRVELNLIGIANNTRAMESAINAKALEVMSSLGFMPVECSELFARYVNQSTLVKDNDGVYKKSFEFLEPFRGLVSVGGRDTDNCYVDGSILYAKGILPYKEALLIAKKRLDENFKYCGHTCVARVAYEKVPGEAESHWRFHVIPSIPGALNDAEQINVLVSNDKSARIEISTMTTNSPVPSANFGNTTP